MAQPSGKTLLQDEEHHQRQAVITHTVETEYQNGKQDIHVLLPDGYRKNKNYPVLYVLPVENGFEQELGYGLGVFKGMDAHNRYNLIMVQMGFELTPWYGDHATDPRIRQASYLKEFVVPFIEERYATHGTPEGRLMLGFSKSGWGAFSLILKYPEYFGFAASWDAPLLFTETSLSQWTGTIYGTAEQLARYRPDLLIPRRKKFFQKRARLVLAGEKYWGAMAPTSSGGGHTVETHKLLEREGIKHHYDNTLNCPHQWDESWMAPTLKVLMDLSEQNRADGARHRQ